MDTDLAFSVDGGRDEAYDLNSNNELTFGSGTAVQAAFQVRRTGGLPQALSDPTLFL
jgi:hypothetical protein